MPISHPFVSGKSDGADATLVRPSNWNADHAGFLTAGLTSDATTNSTTNLVEITGLNLAVPTGRWAFEYYIRYQAAAATTGVAFTVNHTGTVTAFMANHFVVSTLSTASNGIPDQDLNALVGSTGTWWATRAKSATAPIPVSPGTPSVDTLNADMMWRISGMFVATVAGDLELYHRSEVAAASTVKEGSGVYVVKLG
jgi:hypothetical protein